MAKGRARPSSSAQGQRGLTTGQGFRDRYRSPVLDLPVPLYAGDMARYQSGRLSLTELEDRRRFGFPTLTGPRTLTVGPTHLKVAQRSLNADRFARLRKLPHSLSPLSYLPHKVQFATPHKVALCLRRKIRKQVIHALKLTGKGAGGQKHFNAWSDVKC